jgi:hypothetical protein
VLRVSRFVKENSVIVSAADGQAEGAHRPAERCENRRRADS